MRGRHINPADPQLWLRELKGMWRDWAPHPRSIIWKILGLSAALSWLHSSPRLNFVMSESALESLQLWTPLTTGWVLSSSSPLFTLLILGFIAAYKSGALQGEVRKARYFAYSAVLFIMLSALSAVTPSGLVWSLVAEGVTLIWFGMDLERRWGARKFALLCVFTLSLSYLLGALYLFLFGGAHVQGLHPFTRGLILVWGHYIGPHRLALLNVRGDQLRWVVYAFCGFELLLLPPPFGLVTLSAAFLLDQYVRGRIRLPKV